MNMEKMPQLGDSDKEQAKNDFYQAAKKLIDSQMEINMAIDQTQDIPDKEIKKSSTICDLIIRGLLEQTGYKEPNRKFFPQEHEKFASIKSQLYYKIVNFRNVISKQSKKYFGNGDSHAAHSAGKDRD